MDAFISYSHKDGSALDLLHKHLAQLRRDDLLSQWTDRDIRPGGRVDNTISTALERSQIFLALLSPDYIASQYCYDKEFQRALELERNGRLTIVPIILEPCDWLSTPFSSFNALPKDGKPINTYNNINTAFLDVVQKLRKLIEDDGVISMSSPNKDSLTSMKPKNYRVKKDFDSIHKIEFADQTFSEVKTILHSYIEEVLQIDNIKAKILRDEKETLESILVNRNMIATEARLKVHLSSSDEKRDFFHTNSGHKISYSIYSKGNAEDKFFTIANDDYDLYWTIASMYYGNSGEKRYRAKDIADIIWKEWLESVGII
ncbi:MAG: toll/interleukin-1 receptor domain-containing protein [Chitinophagaceae bacterium]|nr:toll/interleukin-1 receptor domain-containing protein [Chitinophagaceae bacterium]